LTSSFDCLAVGYGAWLAGLTLVSLPHPARGVAPDEYVGHLEAMCSLADARLIVIDPAYRSLLPETNLEVVDFDGYKSASFGSRHSLPGSGYGGFVQFTSGSTSDPKGVVLSLDALGAAIEATVEALEPREHEAGVSWLPLSHDMGFIGVCL
ncbi:CoA ligase, partial [mine drainage metagenome]